jgi:nitrite reductase/ring-hydroxylating ferredoxin subunit
VSFRAPDDGFHDAASFESLPEGNRRSVLCGARRILLCHTENGLFAVADACPHALQPLSDGLIDSGRIRCVRHGAEFDLETGRPLNGVTAKPLTVYPLRVRGGRIEVLTG